MTITIRIIATTIKTLLLLCVINAVFACSNEKSNTPTTAAATTQAAATTDKKMVEQIIGIDPITTQFSIGTKGFKDIMVGDAIAKHKASVKKFTLKDGEGSFEAYKITDAEDNPAGYFTPDANNKLLVGDITIETPKASTDKGIKVGSTFQELLKAYPNVEVHGSEQEGRTYAKAGGFSYRLDVPNFTYEVDKSKIKATAKITQIVINRK